MIGDMFPFSQRVLATSAFTLGAAAGSMLGSTGGGMIADAFGWRTAFLALAIPGIIVALLMRFTALILTTFTGFWTSYHFWAAARNLRRDLERAGARV